MMILYLFMIYLGNLEEKLATYQQKILENVYGGSVFSEKQISKWLKKEKLELPVRVIAIENTGRSRPDFNRSKLRTWVLTNNPGMTYITYNGSSEKMSELCRDQEFLFGDSIICNSYGDWMWALRNAIVSVRKKYLMSFTDADLERYSQEDENSKFYQAMQVFQNEKDWQERTEEWLNIVMVRNQATINDCFRKIMFFLTYATMNIDRQVNLSFTYRQALRQLDRTYAFSKLRGLVLRILKDIHPYTLTRAAGEDLSKRHFSEPVEKALKFIQEFYLQSVSRKEASKACFVSAEHLSRIFKHETGYTITEYFQVLRTDHAKKLLLETNKGILDVALESGFESITHFHRVFKKRTSLTPYRYRKENSMVRF